MAGSIIRRGEGKWLVRLFVGRVNGKRKYQSKVVHGTKKDAQRFLTQQLRDRDQGVLVRPSKQTVHEYLDSGWTGR